MGWRAKQHQHAEEVLLEKENLEQNYVNLFIMIIAEWIGNGRKAKLA